MVALSVDKGKLNKLLGLKQAIYRKNKGRERDKWEDVCVQEMEKGRRKLNWASHTANIRTLVSGTVRLWLSLR